MGNLATAFWTASAQNFLVLLRFIFSSELDSPAKGHFVVRVGPDKQATLSMKKRNLLIRTMVVVKYMCICFAEISSAHQGIYLPTDESYGHLTRLPRFAGDAS